MIRPEIRPACRGSIRGNWRNEIYRVRAIGINPIDRDCKRVWILSTRGRDIDVDVLTSRVHHGRYIWIYGRFSPVAALTVINPRLASVIELAAIVLRPTKENVRVRRTERKARIKLRQAEVLVEIRPCHSCGFGVV